MQFRLEIYVFTVCAKKVFEALVQTASKKEILLALKKNY
jgi:hypothetical protein